MKYNVVIMVPHLAEVNNPGSNTQVTNEALSMVSGFVNVHIKGPDGVQVYEPKLLACWPAKSQPEQPLVFDPPPMAA